MSTKKIVLLVFGLATALLLTSIMSGLVETVTAGEHVVKEGWVTGKLDVWSSPGAYAQMWGKIQKYKKSAQYDFSKPRKGEDSQEDESVNIRFNDGGSAHLSGSLRWNMPDDPKKIMELHSKFGSQNEIEHRLIRTVVTNAVYMTGPIMSSTESYAARRNEIQHYIGDQVINGVYRTARVEETVKEASGSERKITRVELVPDPKSPGGFARTEVSPLHDFGITVLNVVVTAIDYDKTVDEQIAVQQKAQMSVQTQMLHAKEAEQKALTVEQEGRAKAAAAKWDQEVKKATAVTAAQQEREVAVLNAQKDLDTARLGAQAAEQNKLATIKEAEGIATAARLKQQASGFQEKKIDTLLEINKVWADALKGSTLVPTVVMGGNGASGPQGLDFMRLLTAKAAQDLGVLLTPHASK